MLWTQNHQITKIKPCYNHKTMRLAIRAYSHLPEATAAVVAAGANSVTVVVVGFTVVTAAVATAPSLEFATAARLPNGDPGFTACSMVILPPTTQTNMTS